MNTKQLFFISLIILSIAMGLNWFKNNKHTFGKKPATNQPKPKQSVNLSDLQLKEDEDENENESEEEEEDDSKKQEGKDKASKVYEGEVEEEEEGEGEEGEDENEESETKPKEGEIASESIDITASDTQSLENPLKDDPYIQEYYKLTRNPFEVSPYAQLVEKLRIEAEKAAHPEEEEKEVIKVPKLLSNAKYSGSIETNRGPKAIVDGGLYEKGNELNGFTVKEIKENIIILESDGDEWLLPKTGVTIEINPETGEYTVSDSYD